MRLLKKYDKDPNIERNKVLQIVLDEKSQDRWTYDETMKFVEAVKFNGINWAKISAHMGNRTLRACENFAKRIRQKPIEDLSYDEAIVMRILNRKMKL